MIAKGELILVEDKAALMKKLGSKQLTLHLAAPLVEVPPALARYGLALGKGGGTLVYRYEMGQGADRGRRDRRPAAGPRRRRHRRRRPARHQRSLEEIFVSLVSEREPAGEGAR